MGNNNQNRSPFISSAKTQYFKTWAASFAGDQIA
jgi:hypothetical protein